MAGGSGYVLSKVEAFIKRIYWSECSEDRSLNRVFWSQAALQIFTREVKERKVCLDEGFKWGGEDVRMGEIQSAGWQDNKESSAQANAWPNWMSLWETQETPEVGQGSWSGTRGSTSYHVRFSSLLHCDILTEQAEERRMPAMWHTVNTQRWQIPKK